MNGNKGKRGEGKDENERGEAALEDKQWVTAAAAVQAAVATQMAEEEEVSEVGEATEAADQAPTPLVVAVVVLLS
ncbi:hypothetical protein L3X38_016326 [Prunus dulcis]|uniref:Uncharacterized protein n=1 Tax=Prunus dulcis TaxID=3755 RepID=A0AAD4Z839_PRUDU|nr:hypothetical protein L3X38_016326 [Prunus dulcis]